MKGFKNIILGFILFSFLACRPGLVPSGWEFLGKRQVNFSLDRDTIAVPAAKRVLTRLMIIVRKNAVEMLDVKVIFENGEVWSPAMRLVFQPNTESRILDLPGNARYVRKVEFRYRSLVRNARRAVVELWGK